MKVITIQDGNKIRLAMIPETTADAFMMKALRAADGNQTMVIPVNTIELQRILNPYKEASREKNKEAVLIELTIDNFPLLTEIEAIELENDIS